MSIVKRIGSGCMVVGLLGILGPFIGIGLRGLNASESRIGGIFLFGGGLLIWLIGLALSKAQ